MNVQVGNQSQSIRPETGFTLIELLVVMAILALLLSMAAPRYLNSLERANEAVLRTDLRILREAIDKHRGDTGRLPDSLERLVDTRYIRAVPIDPIAGEGHPWILMAHPDGVTLGVYDVKSAAPGEAGDRSTYSSW